MNRAWLLVMALPALALAQDRPNEADLFGAPEADAGADVATAVAAGVTVAAADGGADRDSAQLGSTPSQNRFDTEQEKSDPLKIGGSLLLTLQGFALEGQKIEKSALSAPMLLDTYLDARPNDRVRAYAVGRVQYDPTRPASTTSGAGGGSGGGAGGGAGGGTGGGTGTTLGVIGATTTNPTVFLDQLWLRFDIARQVYLTVGRQKVRWGVSHIWYPTDFLNSQPRDPLNPFDVRLGVNMVKVHVPIESLGWNLYGYGILDNIEVGATGLTVERLGGALRGEFVLGPAEIGIGGVWLKGRRPRYGIDASTPIGPVDVFAEAAFRDGRDFLKYNVPSDFTAEDVPAEVVCHSVPALGCQPKLTSYRPEGLVVQVSGGLSYQFNYTDKNMAILSAEYFYNPVGYSGPTEYLVQTFMPSVDKLRPDPSQQIALYGGRHYFALIASAPGLPGADWITLTASNIVNLSDPSGLLRLDAGFRVLTYLTVQAYAAFFYGQSGGELRFRLPDSLVSLIANAPATLTQPPLAQVGVLLRLSI